MKINEIKNILNKGVKKDFPGAHFCTINIDKIDCSYVGYKELVPNEEKLKGDEVYDVASLSKIITTTIIFQLIEEKLINLETKVKNILPKYFSSITTISQLLTHSSGLPALIRDGHTLKAKDELIERMFNETFLYEPDSKIVYSDIGYILLGLIIEKIKEKPLDEVANEYVFLPVGMNNTTYKPNKDLSVPTEFRDDHVFKGLLRGIVHDERSFLLNGISGHAGVFSTAHDYALYINSFLNDEKLINNDTKELILKTNIFKEDLNNNNIVRTYGFNKYEDLPDQLNNVIFHTGFTGCNMWIDYKLKRGFVLLSNGVHPKRKDNNIFPYRKEILSLYFK